MGQHTSFSLGTTEVPEGHTHYARIIRDHGILQGNRQMNDYFHEVIERALPAGSDIGDADKQIFEALYERFIESCLVESGVFSDAKDWWLQTRSDISSGLNAADIGDDGEHRLRIAENMMDKIDAYAKEVVANNLHLQAEEACKTSKSDGHAADVNSNPGWFTGWGKRIRQKEWANMPEDLKDKGTGNSR